MKKLLKKSPTLVHTVRKIKNLFKNKSVLPNERDAFKDMRSLCNSLDILQPVFIDGGAHNGSTILALRDAGFLTSQIFAFEPLEDMAKKIQEFGDTKVTVFPEALGEKDGKLEFNVNTRLVTSSALDSHLAKEYYPGLTETSKRIVVPLVTLDSLIRNKKISQPDIIKLDLQGYELKALAGAEETLKQTKIVFTETEFVELYKNQPLFHDVVAFMKTHGFSLFNIYNSGSRGGRIVACDSLFINDSYFPHSPLKE